MTEHKIHLGDEVECGLTGFRGIASGYIDLLHGQRRITVQPRVKEGVTEIPSAYIIDESSLAVIKTKQAHVEPPGDDFGIQLGDEVEDKVTSLRGIVLEKSVSINGCIRVAVQPTMLGTTGELPKMVQFDVARVVQVSQAKADPAPPEQRKVGGPMERAETWARG